VKYKAVCGPEDFWKFDPDCGEFADIAKAL
jgi:hypothetical protein